LSNLLSPKGTKFVELGGERCWVHNGQTMQRVKGDIVVSYQWLEGVDADGPHPCMVLFPLYPKLDGGSYAIPQKNAYEYVAADGSPTPYLLVAAHNAVHSMGFFADQSTVFRVVDIIVDGLADLVRMPSDQPDALHIQAPTLGIEATAKVEGTVVREQVL
jgi:hypothetical protein